MMLTCSDAIKELSLKSESELTLDYLEDLTKRISIKDPKAAANAITYLYSGSYIDASGNKVSIRDTYIKPELDNLNVRLIDRTYLGEFLDSKDYGDALKKAFINEGYDSTTATDMVKEYTKGTGTTGPWAEASRRFASETSGEVKIFVNNPSDERVWWQTEMPQILSSNSGATTINGVPARHVRNIYEFFGGSGDSEALDRINNAIASIQPNNTNKNALVSALGLADDVELRNKYSLIKNCNDIDTLDVFRILEHRIANGEKAAKIVMGDMVNNFKGNNYLLFKDMKDLRADDFLEYAKHQMGLESKSSAKSLYENSNRLKLTKSLRVAGNVAVAATEIYFTVDFIINLAHLYETGQISAREVGKEAAAYVASTGASWFASSTVASATAVGLPLLGVSAPICAVAVVVFSLAAGIWSGKGADWLMRELYDPAYETTWGAIDVIMSGFNDFHLVDGTEDNDYIDCSSGKITAGILTYPISHRVVIDGMDGDDTLFGSIYDDTIYGGAGNDEINGYLGDDDIYGASGNDIIYGDTGNDEIRGGDGVDIIYGESGNDIVYGDGDSDFLYGGSGNDTIYGGTDADEVFGEGGDDELHGDGGDDLVVGGSGEDLIYGGDGDDILSGEDGNDKLYGGNGNDIVLGDDGNDTLYGENGDDILDGGSGDDYLEGGSGNDIYIYGKGSGNDVIYDYYGINTIKFVDLLPEDLRVVYPPSGYNALITIMSTGETLTIKGFRYSGYYNNFKLEFANGKTLSVDEKGSPFLHIFGTDGDDPDIITFFANSVAEGLDGNDVIRDTSDSNKLYGGAGNDKLYGNGGDDLLDGGSGNDYLEGGYGNDTYIYSKGSGNDTIVDCRGVNIIKFDGLLPEDLRVVYPPSGYDALVTIVSTGETLTIKEFRYSGYYNNFKLEFANGRTGIIDYVSALIELDPLTDEPIETAKTEDELAQVNANILDELYADDNSVSDLLTENDNTVISEITESASTSDENENTADQIDVQVMILTENMAAFSNESNISDSMNMQSNAESLAFADQLLVGTQAS